VAFDSTPQASAIQQGIFGRMTTGQRFKLALEMAESLRNITREGLRSRHPEFTADERSRELPRIVYGFSPHR